LGKTIDEVTEMNVIAFLNYVSYIKDKNKYLSEK